MKGFLKIFLSIVILSISTFVFAKSEAFYVTPDKYSWKDGPSGMAKGTQYMFLEGNPEKSESYILRIKFPAHYELIPHTHPHPERVTVISGTFHIGFGTEMDKKKGIVLPTGSFGFIPTGVPHYAWTGNEGAIVQFQGMGPRQSDYF